MSGKHSSIANYIKPHFDYCSTVWGHTNLDLINKLHKQAARLILDKDYIYATPSAEMFRDLNWPTCTFPKNTEFREAVLVYKALNNLTPPYLSDMFQYVDEVSRPGLRSVTENKLYVPRAHYKSIGYSGPRTWNKLSKAIRQSESVNQFKKRYLSQNKELKYT